MRTRLNPVTQTLKLFTSHLDAWGLTLVISALCLLVHDAASPANVGLLLLITVTCWLAFAANDYFDAPYDAHDPRKRERNHFVDAQPPRPVLLVVFGLLVAGLGVGYGHYGLLGWGVFGVSMVAAWAYSAPPLRLKCRPVADLVMHAVFVQTGPYLVCWLLSGATLIALDIILLSVFMLSSLAAQLEQQTRDYDLDRRHEMNFTIWAGRRRAVLLMRGASIAFGALLVTALVAQVIPAYLLPFGVIGLPVIAHRLFRRADQPRAQWLVVASVLCALAYLGGVWGVRFLN